MKYIIVFVLPFLFGSLYGQRTMYVDDFDSIINNDEDKTRLLTYAASNQFDCLILYDLHTIHAQHDLTDPVTNQLLADFISSAKVKYGITKIGGAGENSWFMENRIIAYNNTRTSTNEKFDILVMEYEFWSSTLSGPGGYYCTSYLTPHALPCDTAGAYQFCIDELENMKSLTNGSSHPMTVEMYVGWPTVSQLHEISSLIDRTLIHAYVSNPSAAYNYALTRLENYASFTAVANVGIIYSAEPNFLGPWLENSSMTQAESIFMNNYSSSPALWNAHVDIDGFVYFAYTHLLCEIGENNFMGTAETDEIHMMTSPIFSTSDIVNNASVVYHSETEISLENGFSISTECSLEAAIQDCQ